MGPVLSQTTLDAEEEGHRAILLKEPCSIGYLSGSFMCWIWWLPSSPPNLRHLRTLSIFSAHQIVTSLTPWSFLSWNMKDHVLHIFYIIPIRCHHSNCLTFIGWFSSDKHNLSTDRHNLSSDFLHFSMWIYHSKVSSQEVRNSVLMLPSSSFLV